MKTKNFDSYRGLDHGLSYLTGLSDFNPWTLRAMMRPHSFTSRTFWNFYNETIEMIKEFMHTKANLIPIPGPGRTPMAAVLNNFLEPGDKLLLINNGYWGGYPEVMVQSYGFELVPLTVPINRPVVPEEVERKLVAENDIKAVHIVHVETETGIVNPIKKVGEIVHKVTPNALYIVDSATGFPGNKLEVDNWGIDVDYFVSHKGFNGPAGLNFYSVNERAMEVFQKRTTLPRGWYTSLQTWKDIWLENPNEGRHCLASFPSIILYAMRAKLDLMNEMGEENYLKKYELASKAVRMGIRKMSEPADLLLAAGPRCKGCPGCDTPDPNMSSDRSGRFCSQTDVCIAYPKGTDWKKILDTMEERYWITAPHFGYGDRRKDGYFYSANGMRIGLVNDQQHYPRNILAVITAIGFCLKEAGVEGIRWEKGTEAANEVIKEMQKELNWNYYED
ncbi:pyridoxal-phosphate-dependent aminotransferase family protein [Chloroflexota bacterium]